MINFFLKNQSIKREYLPLINNIYKTSNYCFNENNKTFNKLMGISLEFDNNKHKNLNKNPNIENSRGTYNQDFQVKRNDQIFYQSNIENKNSYIQNTDNSFNNQRNFYNRNNYNYDENNFHHQNQNKKFKRPQNTFEESIDEKTLINDFKSISKYN